MKNIFTLTIFFLFICTGFSQEKTTVFLNDGTIKSGLYKTRNKTFSMNSSSLMIISKDSDDKFSLDEVSKLIIHRDTADVHYDVIDVKKNYNDKKSEKKLGQIAYESPKVKMYLVKEVISSGGNVGMRLSHDTHEIYVKKSKDAIAYNMGNIYGAGARGIKKRVRDYFFDCPKLVALVDNNKIKKDNTLEMVKFYDKNCGAE